MWNRARHVYDTDEVKVGPPELIGGARVSFTLGIGFAEIMLGERRRESLTRSIFVDLLIDRLVGKPEHARSAGESIRGCRESHDDANVADRDNEAKDKLAVHRNP